MNQDLAVSAVVSEATEQVRHARALGSRGSRDPVEGADTLTPTATAVLTAIPAWWAAQAKAVGLDGRWLDVASAVGATAPVTLPSESPLSESWGLLTPDQVGAAYVGALSPATRARHGRHYTPGRLASELWAMARAPLGAAPEPTPLPGLVRDPACGAGALLLPALREHLHASFDVDPSITLAGLPSVLEGIDNDEAAVWVANVVLAAEMLPTLARVPESRRRPLPALAKAGDGLDPVSRAARAVLMNPPYGRVKLGPHERSRFAHVLYGHANLYGLFMAAAVESLDDRGVLASLTPTSFTSGRYFTNLRSYLSQTAPMTSVMFVQDRAGVFASVLQETCLATFERRKRRKTRVRCMGGGTSDIAEVRVQRGAEPWLLPRRSDDAPVAAAAASMVDNLASLGWRASTGPLVWNRRRQDLHPNWGLTRSHVIWAADLDGGTLHRDPSRDSMRHLALTKQSDTDIMVMTEPAVLVQRTTAPEQARRLVAAHLGEADLSRRHGRVTIENHVNVLRPTPGCEPVIDAATLARILSTRTLDQVVRCISGSVALSAYELESLPFPPPEIVSSWTALTDNELEAAVSSAYQ